MRLGAQHLERAWADGAEDFAERLKRYTNTTVQQIDALSTLLRALRCWPQTVLWNRNKWSWEPCWKM